MSTDLLKQGQLAIKNRPSEVALWQKNGRKYAILPKIDDLSLYRLLWQSWWWSLQPKWRQLSDGTVSRDMPDTLEQWEGLCQGGSNRLFMVVLALAWWATELSEVSDDDELCAAIDDATWVMQCMASSLKAGREGGGVKRARVDDADSLDEVAAKR